LLFNWCLFLHQVSSIHWALLVAGSNGYWNYRHQADVCHAYQILHQLGIPDSNIITMMYDDIASSEENPFKGNLVNVPNGTNVYEGVLKDYTGEDVNPKNFLNILSGNATAMKGIGSGKVIASTSEDKIFVFFSDHGATNLIAFPSDYLYADELISTLQTMKKRNQYSQMVFYLEACESGSMFNHILSKNLSIYATTASSPTESSYACYFDSSRQAYVADCYSINWMMNTETVDVTSETFKSQYSIIKKETNTSSVCQYGNIKISNDKLSDFFEKKTKVLSKKLNLPEPEAVDQRDVELSILRKKLELTTTETQRKIIQIKIQNILNRRIFVDRLFSKLGVNQLKTLEIQKLNDEEYNLDYDCFKKSLVGIESVCGKFDHYGLKYTRQLSKMCNVGIKANYIIEQATKFCQ